MLWLPLKVYYQWWFMQNPVSSTASSVSIKTRLRGRAGCRVGPASPSLSPAGPARLLRAPPSFVYHSGSVPSVVQPNTERGNCSDLVGWPWTQAETSQENVFYLYFSDYIGHSGARPSLFWMVQGLNRPKEPLRSYSLISMNNIWWLSGACGHLELMVKYVHFLKWGTVFQAHLSQWLPLSRGHRVFHGASPVASLSNY